MFTRRLASAIAIVTLALGLSVPALAQDEGVSVTVHLATCTATGTAPSVMVSDSGTPPDTLRDCSAGWSENDIAMAIDGIAPDSMSSTTAEWSSVASGTHVITVDLGGDVEFTVADAPVELWAYYVQHELPADDDSGDDADSGNNGSADDGNSSGDDGVSDLPRTGTGPAGEPGVAFALVFSSLLAAGVVSAAGSRAARQQ